jgi:hypothetical protein
MVFFLVAGCWSSRRFDDTAARNVMTSHFGRLFRRTDEREQLPIEEP